MEVPQLAARLSLFFLVGPKLGTPACFFLEFKEKVELHFCFSLDLDARPGFSYKVSVALALNPRAPELKQVTCVDQRDLRAVAFRFGKKGAQFCDDGRGESHAI